jgi:hypothetical protein
MDISKESPIDCVCKISGFDINQIVLLLCKRRQLPKELCHTIMLFYPTIECIFNPKNFMYKHNKNEFFNEISIGEFRKTESYFNHGMNASFYSKFVFSSDLVEVDMIIIPQRNKNNEWRQLWKIPYKNILTNQWKEYIFLYKFATHYSFSSKPKEIQILFYEIWIKIHYFILLHYYFKM